jgi:hypothetical protein
MDLVLGGTRLKMGADDSRRLVLRATRSLAMTTTSYLRDRESWFCKFVALAQIMMIEMNEAAKGNPMVNLMNPASLSNSRRLRWRW